MRRITNQNAGSGGVIEQILLSSGSFDGVRETGGFGQPLHALYPQIRSVLASEVEPEAGSLLAEPVVDRAKNRIDWYTEGDPERPPVALSDLPEEQRRSMLARIDDLLGRGRELAERYIASGDARRVRLGAILRAVLAAPAESQVFLVENRPVITRWGFSPDRPWDSPEGGSGGSMVPPPVPAQPFRDVAVPFRADDQIEKVVRFEAENHLHGRAIEDVIVNWVKTGETKEEQIDDEITPAMDAIVLKSLSKDPRDRYQDASEFRDDILRDFAQAEAPRLAEHPVEPRFEDYAFAW